MVSNLNYTLPPGPTVTNIYFIKIDIYRAWTHPKSDFSTLYPSPLKLLKDKLKSLKNIQCVKSVKKLVTLKSFYFKKWTLNHSHTERKSHVLTITEPSYPKPFVELVSKTYLLYFKKELKMLPPFPLKPVKKFINLKKHKIGYVTELSV